MKKKVFLVLPVIALLLWIIILFVGDAIKGKEKISIVVSEKFYKNNDYLASFNKAFIRATVDGENPSIHYWGEKIEFSIMSWIVKQCKIEDVDISTTFPDVVPQEGLYVLCQGKVSWVWPRFGRHFQVVYKDLTHALVTIKDAKNNETLVVITYDKPYFAGSAYWEERAYQKLQSILQEGKI